MRLFEVIVWSGRDFDVELWGGAVGGDSGVEFGCSHYVSFAVGTLAFTSLCGFSQGHFHMRRPNTLGIIARSVSGHQFFSICTAFD